MTVPAAVKPATVDRAQFVEIRSFVLQEQFRGLGIAQDGIERLIQFVREGNRELPEQGDSPGRRVAVRSFSASRSDFRRRTRGVIRPAISAV